MTRKTRRTLFYVLLGLFFVVGAAVVLYAQGWRLDLGTWHAEKVGAIFVRSFPADTRITLNDVPTANRSGFLSRGTLISDLFPKHYELGLAADGYLDWHEDVETLPSLVTELKYAVLVPQTSATIATGTITNFSVVSAEAITQAADGTINWRGETVGHGEIVSVSANLRNLVTKNATTGIYSLYDFTTGISTDLPLQNITGITIDPYDATNIIAENNIRIWIFDAGTETITSVERAPADTNLGISLAVSPSLLAWTRFSNASDTSAVVWYDKFSKTTSVSSSTVPKENVAIKWIRDGLLGVLQADGSLYTYDTGAQQFQKLADDVKDFEPSTDGSILAALEYRSVEIFPFTDAETYRRFNLPNMLSVKSVAWYKDMHHLFVEYPDHAAFLDLDDLRLQNFTTVAQGTSPFYDAQADALYIVDPAQTLIRFDFPK